MPATQGTFRIITFNGPDGQDYKYITEGFLLKGENNEFVKCTRIYELDIDLELARQVAPLNVNKLAWQIVGRHYNFETGQATFQIQYGNPTIFSESIIAENNEIGTICIGNSSGGNLPPMSYNDWLVAKGIKRFHSPTNGSTGSTGPQPIYKKTRSGKSY